MKLDNPAPLEDNLKCWMKLVTKMWMFINKYYNFVVLYGIKIRASQTK